MPFDARPTVRDRVLYGSHAERICADMAQIEEAEWSNIGRDPRFPSALCLPLLILAGAGGLAVAHIALKAMLSLTWGG